MEQKKQLPEEEKSSEWSRAWGIFFRGAIWGALLGALVLFIYEVANFRAIFFIFPTD